uniref:G-protein coupled receptors family 1 profile domain-containing protein n=1 Tax=Nothobranchius furzeri TaxID=105023 RepID=A0A8C6LJB4_NOTFU
MNSSSYIYNVLNNLNFRSNATTSAVRNVIAVVLGLIIIFINGTLVHTFRKNQIFYMKPRYILYIHLVVNDMIQLTTTITLLVFSYVLHNINSSLCLPIVVVAVFTTHNTPLNLAAMAVECYVAVCFPLRHAELCTIKRTYILIGCIWALIIPDLFVVLATRPAEFFSSNIFCLWTNIFTIPQLQQKRDALNILYLVSVWLILFYCYFRILFTAQAASANAKKARNTVLLHSFQLLLCMLSYLYNITIQGLTNLFPKDVLVIRYVVSLLIQVMPRLISPMVYGVRDKMFREYLKRYLFVILYKRA